MLKKLLLTTWIMALTSPVFALIIDSETAGLADPVNTVTFSEHTFADTSQVSTEFADLGVTFEPRLFYRTQSAWEDIGVFGPNLRSGDPIVDTFSILLADARSSVAMVLIASPITPTTITAKLGGAEVESFTTTVDLTANSFYGFTDIALDEIEIAYTAVTSWTAPLRRCELS